MAKAFQNNKTTPNNMELGFLWSFKKYANSHFKTCRRPIKYISKCSLSIFLFSFLTKVKMHAGANRLHKGLFK